MKQIFLGALIVGITALSACSNETRPASESAAKADSAAKPAMLAQPSTTPATQPGAATTTTPPTGTNAATTGEVPRNADGSVALNPPHGQPNHRCDIPVGAPLDSPPGQNAGGMGASGSPIKVTPGNGAQMGQPQTIQVNPQTVQVNPQTTPAKPQTATKP